MVLVRIRILIGAFLGGILFLSSGVKAQDFTAVDEGRVPAPSSTATSSSSSSESTTSVLGDAATTKSSKSSLLSEIQKNIRVNFFDFATAKAHEANRGYGALQTYNYFSFEYRLGRDEKIAFRPAFTYSFDGLNSRGREVPAEFSWSDAYLAFVSYRMPWLPFEMDYKTEIRAYVPTSESSKNAGMMTRLRGDLKAYIPASTRSTFFLWFIPDYFVNARPDSKNERGFTQGNRHYGYIFSLNYYYNATSIFGVGASVGHEQMWTHAVPDRKIDVSRSENMSLSSFLGVNYKGLLTHIGAEQSRNIARPRDEFILGRDTELQYFARTYYRF